MLELAHSITGLFKSDMEENELDVRRKAIADREDEYHAQRLKAVLSPVRADPFADGNNFEFLFLVFII